MKKICSLCIVMIFVFCCGCNNSAATSVINTPTVSVLPDVSAGTTQSAENSPLQNSGATPTVSDFITATPSPAQSTVTSAVTSTPEYNSNLRPITEDNTVTLSSKYGYYEMMSDVNMLIKKYPQYLTLKSLGTSEFGRDIPVLIMGNANNPRKILIVGSSHAREYANSAILMKTVETYCADMLTSSYNSIDYTSLINSVSIWFVPMHNPDGVEISINGLNSVPEEYKATVCDIFNRSVKKNFLTSGSFAKWKANGLGYDLNRDYGVGKKSATKESRPMSENYGGDFQSKEGKLIAELIKQENFSSVTSYHSCGQIIYWGFYATGEFKQQCYEMACAMSNLNGYRLVEDTQKSENDYAYLGLKDWFMKEYKKPGFTIETGSGSAPLSLSDIKSAVKKNLQIPALLAWYEYSSV